MRGKFSIGDSFNVFDEYGILVGRFTPSGADGLFLLIGLFFAWTIGFLIYLIVRLVMEGFRAARRNDWSTAVVYLTPLWILIAVFIFAVFTHVTWAIEKEQGVQYITIENVKDSDCYEGRMWIGYDVVNNWNRPVRVWSPNSLLTELCTTSVMSISHFPGGGMNLNPGERVRIYSVYDGYCTASVEISKNNSFDLCPIAGEKSIK